MRCELRKKRLVAWGQSRTKSDSRMKLATVATIRRTPVSIIRGHCLTSPGRMSLSRMASPQTISSDGSFARADHGGVCERIEPNQLGRCRVKHAPTTAVSVILLGTSPTPDERGGIFHLNGRGTIGHSRSVNTVILPTQSKMRAHLKVGPFRR